MPRTSFVIAGVAAVALAAIGFMKGTYAAGGSDSSCYALMAEAFAAGHLQPTSALGKRVPWPDASTTFTPGGFVPSEVTPFASAPICAPGFSLLLAPAVTAAGSDALFWITPLAGALLVWMGFLAGRRLAGPLAGAMAAVLIAVSPPALYQVVQPMNDITTAALWMGTFTALIHRRLALAGSLCGAALLIRPNLLPLAIVSAGYVASIAGAQAMSRTARFALGALPFVAAVLWLNDALYGSPLRTGYGQAVSLFSVAFIPTNAVRYFRWLVETHTAFPLLALAAPLVIERDRRADTLLALGLAAATWSIYLVYTPFDDWSYLRFLLPAITLTLVLASAVTVRIVRHVAANGRYVLLGVVTGGLCMFFVRAAGDRHAFRLQFLEQRYRSAGVVVRQRLPSAAVVFSVWDSGAVRFHGRKDALSWEALDPAWLDRSIQWLDTHGHRPYILVESWEEPGFRRRFSERSDIGRLDWPPTYEIDRVVRIYDPRDRARYHRGERVDTEFLWPLRD